MTFPLSFSFTSHLWKKRQKCIQHFGGSTNHFTDHHQHQESWNYDSTDRYQFSVMLWPANDGAKEPSTSRASRALSPRQKDRIIFRLPPDLLHLEFSWLFRQSLFTLKLSNTDFPSIWRVFLPKFRASNFLRTLTYAFNLRFVGTCWHPRLNMKKVIPLTIWRWKKIDFLNFDLARMTT